MAYSLGPFWHKDHWILLSIDKNKLSLKLGAPTPPDYQSIDWKEAGEISDNTEWHVLAPFPFRENTAGSLQGLVILWENGQLHINDIVDDYYCHVTDDGALDETTRIEFQQISDGELELFEDYSKVSDDYHASLSSWDLLRQIAPAPTRDIVEDNRNAIFLQKLYQLKMASHSQQDYVNALKYLLSPAEKRHSLPNITFINKPTPEFFELQRCLEPEYIPDVFSAATLAVGHSKGALLHRLNTILHHEIAQHDKSYKLDIKLEYDHHVDHRPKHKPNQLKAFSEIKLLSALLRQAFIQRDIAGMRPKDRTKLLAFLKKLSNPDFCLLGACDQPYTYRQLKTIANISGLSTQKPSLDRMKTALGAKTYSKTQQLNDLLHDLLATPVAVMSLYGPEVLSHWCNVLFTAQITEFEQKSSEKSKLGADIQQRAKEAIKHSLEYSLYCAAQRIADLDSFSELPAATQSQITHHLIQYATAQTNDSLFDSLITRYLDLAEQHIQTTECMQVFLAAASNEHVWNNLDFITQTRIFLKVASRFPGLVNQEQGINELKHFNGIHEFASNPKIDNDEGAGLLASVLENGKEPDQSKRKYECALIAWLALQDSQLKNAVMKKMRPKRTASSSPPSRGSAGRKSPGKKEQSSAGSKKNLQQRRTEKLVNKLLDQYPAVACLLVYNEVLREELGYTGEASLQELKSKLVRLAEKKSHADLAFALLDKEWILEEYPQPERSAFFTSQKPQEPPWLVLATKHLTLANEMLKQGNYSTPANINAFFEKIYANRGVKVDNLLDVICTVLDRVAANELSGTELGDSFYLALNDLAEHAARTNNEPLAKQLLETNLLGALSSKPLVGEA